MPRGTAQSLRQGVGGLGGRWHLVAEKTAALYLEANISEDVEAIRAREGQLPEITLGDRRGEAIRAGGRRQSSQP